MANALTVSRIVLSLALLVPPALSPAFYALYTLTGVTDMLDGWLARRTGTESDLGAKLDSIADLVFVIVCLAKLLPAIDIPLWLWVWVVAIAVVKVANVASGYLMRKRLVMLHTIANKAAGLSIFLIPFALPFVGVAIPAIPACIVATFAAIQEGHLIRTGGAES